MDADAECIENEDNADPVRRQHLLIAPAGEKDKEVPPGLEVRSDGGEEVQDESLEEDGRPLEAPVHCSEARTGGRSDRAGAGFVETSRGETPVSAQLEELEVLKRRCQEKLDQAEHEWRALMALKQDVAVMLLSRSLGKQAAQAKVESALASEQLQQDQLIKLRLKNIKLKIKIQRLEVELYKEEEGASRPLQIRFEQLQAMRLEQKKQAEKQGEDSMKLQKKISSCLEVLSNIKEKLDWSQGDLQAKRDQLAKLEATVSERRDLLTWTKQACRGLQRSNLRLKEERGLLGNSILLRDFEDTVDACQQLEDKLENLRCRHEEIVFSCKRYNSAGDSNSNGSSDGLD